MKINYASEYMLEKSIIEKARNNELLCIKNNYVLVEMSFISKPNDLHQILFEIIVNGYIPVIAHPERYFFMYNDYRSYYKLKKIGCKFQLNLLSCTGYYGNDVIKISNKLLSDELIDYVGSDIHNLNHVNKFLEKIKIDEIDKLNIAFEANQIFN